MKKRLKLFLLITLASIKSAVFAAAPPVLEWQKCIGGSLQDIPGALIHSNDGNYILLSNVDSYDGDVSSNHGSTDIWISKIDTNGTIIWQKSIGGTSIDVGTSISELANGKLIISGYTSSSNGDITKNQGNFDALLICTDNNGNLLWTNTYGGSKVDLCYTHVITKDGGFVLGGGSYSNDGDVFSNYGDQDFWVMKTDSFGNLLWQKTIGGNSIDVCYSIAEDALGNIIACGATNSTLLGNTLTHGNFDLWVIKYNSNGNILWNKTYGGSNYETAQSILIDSRERILIGGYTRSNDGDISSNRGFGDCWVIQIDGSGSLITRKTFGGSGGENLYSIIETAEGGYLFTSGTTSADMDITNYVGQEDIWLYKTDESFHVEWSHNYGGSSNDRPVSVVQNPDGGFLVAGYTFSNNHDVSGLHGTSDIWLLNLECRVPNAFYSTNLNACLGDTLQFLDASTFASEGNWYLNNSLYSTGTTAEVIFNTTGVYHLQLNVQTCYYASSVSNDILVTDCKLPVVNFYSPGNSICANSEIVFNNTSANATGWLWEFPGGNPSTSNQESPVVHYDQPGTYNVMLTVSNSHGSQTMLKLNFVRVNAPPAIPVITSAGNELMSTPAFQYQWFYNNAPMTSEISQNHYAGQEGFYSVQVTDINSCSSISEAYFYSSTGITNEINGNNLSVYPNPAAKDITVNLPVNTTGRVYIFNINGQQLTEIDIKNSIEKVNINIEQFPAGIYSLVYTDNKGKSTQQSIIKY